MIIIDASVVWDAFGQDELRSRILSIIIPLKAPPILIREITEAKGHIMKDYGLTSTQFDSIWQSFSHKIIFEDITDSERIQARTILKNLTLDINDSDYIALCLRYQTKTPTFWTYDSPFVVGISANILRKKYNIFANFNI
jgi:predicted nucleic acid-binding protein